MNYDFIKAVDAHLTRSIKETNFKPQTSFIQFVEENKTILQLEVRRLYAIMNNSYCNDEDGVAGDDAAKKKHIHKDHVNLIKFGKFIPGLFVDCKCSGKTRKNRK